MFTLQILDRGQTLLFPLDRRAVQFGSGASAELVLGEEGVADLHARFVPHEKGVRLEPLAATRVNGQELKGPAELALGDRIELGRAVLVVGRTVARAATADDVLAARPRTGESAPRRPVVAMPTRRRNLLPVLIPVVLLGGIGYLATRPSTDLSVQGEIGTITGLRNKGRLDEARTAIVRLQRAWRDSTDGRLARLDAEQRAIDAVQAAAERLTEAVLLSDREQGEVQWILELRRLEAEGKEDERVAAYLVRADLNLILMRRNERSPRSVAGSPSPAGSAAAVRSPEPTASVEDHGAAVVPQDTLDPGVRDEVARLCAAGQFAQAFERLERSGAAGAAADQVRSSVRAAARAEMQRLVSAARASIEAGRAGEAKQALQAARTRFPATAEFADLDAMLASAEGRLGDAVAVATPSREESLQSAAAPSSVAAPTPMLAPAAAPAVDEAVRMASLAAVREEMDAVRRAETAGDYADAARRLEAAAQAIAARDPEFAGRLRTRADEARLCVAWHDAIAAAAPKGTLRGSTADGETFELQRCDGPALVVVVRGETRQIAWPDVGAPGIAALADTIAATGEPALGAATLLYRLGENKAAEAVLAKALKADAALQPRVDGVIARGRGEPVDGPGYQLDKDGFVSRHALGVQKSAEDLATRIEAALRSKDAALRETLVADALASGPDGAAILTAAMQREFDRQVQKLDSGTLKKSLAKLEAQREALDAARKHAKDLIYDEVRYFYPYKPPAVSAAKFAEYTKVQKEVTSRVEALRVLWDDSTTKVRVPSSLRADLDRLDWSARVLAQLGKVDETALQRIDWARALPSGESVGLQQFCKTAAERAELEEWQRIEAYNELVTKTATSAQKELLRITNDYRAMFRHRPLAWVPNLGVSAQAHGDEMSKLGYFSHFSETPGRRTPFERMQLAGYTSGVSENIALVDGARGAHEAWCTSSGHHRNLLDPENLEIGIGANGRYWVENFGAGRLHREQPAWLEAGSAR
ncbi:MAG: hypothetical protein JNL12_14015 [Planctomycetes bacterium]|nr:hypothetical protein [Planctomycetota bacterium]